MGRRLNARRVDDSSRPDAGEASKASRPREGGAVPPTRRMLGRQGVIKTDPHGWAACLFV
jgi:hypothetical protein